MPIATIKQKTALYLGEKYTRPRKVSLAQEEQQQQQQQRSSTRSASNSNLRLPTNKHSQHSHHTLTVYRCCLHAVHFFCRALWEVGWLCESLRRVLVGDSFTKYGLPCLICCVVHQRLVQILHRSVYLVWPEVNVRFVVMSVHTYTEGG